jgi:uncharacterized protein YyaL (SSP411 family)
MPNRLGNEKSPYLLQHANNPVDWYPWGEEAFSRAREADKPIFLSIGYATCHWCHVMERESFEDRDVAALLNECMVSIKVDREERPDVDGIYMSVCQMLTGRGGWPLSVFMTPDRRPFFAGSYFPKESRRGMPGFVDIIRSINNLWHRDRDQLIQACDRIIGAMQGREEERAESGVLGLETLAKGYDQLQHLFDEKWGGFGKAPKFPTPHHLTFLLRWHERRPESGALAIVEKTLEGMRNGGMFDQVGLGFHRYSVDDRWLVPHFEKMLYDQALLAMAYAEAHQVTGRSAYADTLREIFEYVLRDMQGAHGGFFSAEDADSEGKEGLFYVWTPDEVKAVLGVERGDLFCGFYDITAAGNFEQSRSIPHRPKSPGVYAKIKGMEEHELNRILEECRKELYVEREKRVHPLKDDKVLTSWNGLMIAALAKGYQTVGEPSWLDAAVRAADFVLDTLVDASGRLRRRFRDGEVAHLGYLDDYAFLVWGLIELYESTLEVRFLEKALEVNGEMLRLFWDEAEGACFFTGGDGESLIVREKPVYDGAIPSGNSVAALNLHRLGRMTGDTALEQRGEMILDHFSGLVSHYPSAYTQFLNALDFAVGPNQEVVIAGEPEAADFKGMLGVVHRSFGPRRVLMGFRDDAGKQRLVKLCPYLEPLVAVDGEAVAYVCENHACRRPVGDPESLRQSLGG